MFAGIGANEQEMLQELEDGRTQATDAAIRAQQTATSMQAKQQDAIHAVAKIPAAIGTWGIVWAAGVYWFILRPLLK